MSNLPDNSPPPYELHDQSHGDALITAIQNDKAMWDSLQKMSSLENRKDEWEEWFFLIEPEARLTSSAKDQGLKVYEEYAAAIMEFTSSLRKSRAHARSHRELYAAISNLSAKEIERLSSTLKVE